MGRGGEGRGGEGWKGGREGETEELCVAQSPSLTISMTCPTVQCIRTSKHMQLMPAALGAFGSAYLQPWAYSALRYTCYTHVN